jgi:RimJ/RimL family protein N-acetyltransferase
MVERKNEYDQPIGPPLEGWTPKPFPVPNPMEGRYCRIEKLEERHASALFSAYAEAKDDSSWTYLFSGPFPSESLYADWVRAEAQKCDPQHYVIIDARTHKPVGTAALMRIEPSHGVIEIGHIHYAPVLKTSGAATEAMYLFMRRVFDELGYRRYEWKCDALNAPSCRAAERLGFRVEGIFRQAVVYKGRSRDTAWFSVIDTEWPILRAGFEAWLAAENFDASGAQRKSLSAIRNAL